MKALEIDLEQLKIELKDKNNELMKDPKNKSLQEEVKKLEEDLNDFFHEIDLQNKLLNNEYSFTKKAHEVRQDDIMD